MKIVLPDSLKNKKNLLIALLLIVIGFCIYANSFHNEMFWDDDDFILKNRYIKDWKYFPQYFTENVIAGNHLKSNYWRPILLILFSTEWHLWKNWAPGYHAVSTLFHSLDSVLLFSFLFLLFKRRWLTFLTSLIFLVHPVQTEAIVYANAMSDSVGAFFVLGGLILYTKYLLLKNEQNHAEKSLYILSILMYILGLLSRETAFVMPAYLVIVEYVLLENKHAITLEKIRKIFFRILPFIFLAGVYLGLRATVLNFINSFNFYNQNNLFTSNFLVRLFTFFKVLTIYFSLLFLPVDLHVERTVPLETSLASVSSLQGAFLFCGLIILAYWQWRRQPLITFGVLWFFIGMMPSSNLLIPINALLYEHFLYLPLIGIYLIMIYYGMNWARKINLEKWALALFLTYIFFFCALTINRNRDWKNPITFYENLLKYAPDSYRVINNLGMTYADRGFLGPAEQTYKKALALLPNNPVAHHNLANLYRDTGRTDLALQSYHEALRLDPKFLFAYASLAQLYLDQKDYPNAQKTLEAYLVYTNEKVYILSLLAEVAKKQHNWNQAQKYLQAAIKLEPKNKTLISQLKAIELGLPIKETE